MFADLHTDHGVDLRCNVAVTAIRPATPTRPPQARCYSRTARNCPPTSSSSASASPPTSNWPDPAGLNVDNGILTDEHLRTSDNDILAAGDVANAYHPLLGRQLRVEHWANALHQPVVAAKTMLGQTATYDRLPYFFTDQYDLGMEYLGYTDPDGYDQVVIRGDTASREFIAFWLHRRTRVAGMNVNMWDVTEPIRALIQSGEQVDATRLSDPAIPLSQLLGC